MPSSDEKKSLASPRTTSPYTASAYASPSSKTAKLAAASAVNSCSPSAPGAGSASTFFSRSSARSSRRRGALPFRSVGSFSAFPNPLANVSRVSAPTSGAEWSTWSGARCTYQLRFTGSGGKVSRRDESAAAYPSRSKNSTCPSYVGSMISSPRVAVSRTTGEACTVDLWNAGHAPPARAPFSPSSTSRWCTKEGTTICLCPSLCRSAITGVA